MVSRKRAATTTSKRDDRSAAGRTASAGGRAASAAGPTRKLPVAILGATGTVGQRFIQLLNGHPWFEVTEVMASDQSAGRPYAEAVGTRWKLPTSIPGAVAGLRVRGPGDPLRRASSSRRSTLRSPASWRSTTPARATWSRRTRETTEWTRWFHS